MLKMIREASPSDPVLVFVHGILSDSDSCWRNSKGVAWPELVASDPAFARCGVFAFTYQTSISGKRFSITDAADTLWDELRSSRLVGSGMRLVFVCHSMGGVVARKMLVKNQAQLVASEIKTVGLFLVASPSMGSRWATRLLPLSWLLGHAQAMALPGSENNLWLHDLRREFIDLIHSGSIQVIGKELVEDRPLRLMRWAWLSPIVLSIEGAIFFPNSLKIGNSDHSSIAKPEDTNAQQHDTLRLFIEDFKKRCADGFCTILEASSFEAAAWFAARQWGLDVDLRGFTEDELGVTLDIERRIQARDAEELLKKLGSVFPAGRIRDYEVTIDGATAVLAITRGSP